jgi:flagellar biosynthetic protein FliR
MRVRLALTLAFTLVVTPAVLPLLDPGAVTVAGLALRMAPEVAAGLVLGITLRLLVHALQIAGTIAAQSISLAQFLGGAGPDPQPAISQLLVMGGLALAVTAGLHLRMAEALIGSYVLFPAGRMPDPAMMTEWGVGQVGRATALAFAIAAPFVIASLVYNLALGVINRAMPQLMVAFVGAPALTLGGLALLLLVAPLGLSAWFVAMGETVGHFGDAR